MRNRLRPSPIFLIPLLLVAETFAKPDQSGDKLMLSAHGPFRLGAAPIEIPLRGDSSLRAAVAELGPTERIYLVLSELSADEQPGVVFRIYLTGTADAKKEDKGQLLGTVNFFNTVPLKAAKPGARAGSTRSIDVTEILRNLSIANRLREPVIMTIRPSGAPVASSKPVIGRVELVVSHSNPEK
jgi:tyrosinase